MSKKTSHIDISERKLLLRMVDIFLFIFSLWLASFFIKFEYMDFQNSRISMWVFTLIVYILLFGEIFQLYNLDISNNRFQVVRSVVLTTVITTIFYIFTPFIAPSLPENRLQIIYFFLLLTIPVILWRFLYIWMFFSPKYFKDILIIGHSSRLRNIFKLVKNKGFHNVSAYISESEIEGFSKFEDIHKVNLPNLVTKNAISEIIISTSDLSDTIITNLNKQLILLFEEGINIKSYESFYEEITNRVPKNYLDYDFYKNINFSKNYNNRLYLFSNRLVDILISSIGLFIFLFLIPFVFIGNLIANRGPLFYTQNRVGKKGKMFKILKLRSMITNAEKSSEI